MKTLHAYLNGLPTNEQADFAKRAGTTIGYLRKAISAGQKIGESLCINLERESNGEVTCESMRDDVDWAYIRSTGCAGERRKSSRRHQPDRRAGKGA